MYTEYVKTPMSAPILLEKDNLRYEYFTRPVRKSNIDDTIVGYKPEIKVSQKLIGGSTEHWESCSVERGNEHFKKALAMGFKRVVKRSWA